MEQGFKNIATRAANGDKDFRDLLIDQAGISMVEAVAVQDRYLKNKFAKRDWASGRISVIHGGLLDHDVILRAVESVNS